MSPIKFAPLSIPFPRRRQTAALLVWILLAPALIFAFFYLLAIPALTPWMLAYAVFVVLDPSPEVGGRKLMALRRCKLWFWARDYFPISLVKTADLSPNERYIFGYHPHGIIAVGSWINFGTEANGFADKFPGINLRLMTLPANFQVPFWREALLSCGITSVSRRSCDNVLDKGPGNACMIVVGGASESLLAKPHSMNLIIKRRYGFVKMALRHGACLVPVVSFGENDLWDQVNNPPGSFVWRMQTTFQRYMTFTAPLFFGRGVFQYSFGFLPHRRPVTSVVGTPISCPQTSNPTREQIVHYQRLYMDQLQTIYDEYKDIYAPNRKSELAFVD